MEIPPIRTGFSDLIEPIKPDPELLKNVNALLLVLLEKAMIGAAFYAKEAKRNSVTPGDIRIALMYEAHEFWNHTDLDEKVAEYREFDSENEESDSSDIEEVEDIAFTFAESNHPKVIKMNNFFYTWNTWKPEDSTVIALKKAIDANFTDM